MLNNRLRDWIVLAAPTLAILIDAAYLLNRGEW